MNPQDFEPGIVLCDDFDMILEFPELETDVLWVQYPNAAEVYVHYHPGENPQPARPDFSPNFTITVVHGEDTVMERCTDKYETAQELVAIAAAMAKSLPSIRRLLFPTLAYPFSPIEHNELVLDPLAPLGSQLDVLKENLLVIDAGWKRRFTVDWLPPHDADGRFVIRLRDEEVTPAALLFEEEARTIDQLTEALERCRLLVQGLDDEERKNLSPPDEAGR